MRLAVKLMKQMYLILRNEKQKLNLWSKLEVATLIYEYNYCIHSFSLFIEYFVKLYELIMNISSIFTHKSLI